MVLPVGYISKSTHNLALLMLTIQIGLRSSPFWRAVLGRFGVERESFVIRRWEATRFEVLQAKSSARLQDRPPSDCYSMPAQVLPDSHHGVTRYAFATAGTRTLRLSIQELVVRRAGDYLKMVK